MESILNLTVTSAGEFLKNRPSLDIAVITSEHSKLCIAFERPVNDIELDREQIKELIKTLTNIL